MKIDINKLRYITFPDGQLHLNLNIELLKSTTEVICRIRNSDDLFKLLLFVSALRENLKLEDSLEIDLHIPYLMGARYDRVINEGDSFDLRVVAEIINKCRFHRVFVYDIHSEVALNEITNCINRSNSPLVSKYIINKDIVLICPDNGAKRHLDRYEKLLPSIKNIVFCEKSRDKDTGKISLTVLKPELCKNQYCLIIDDICDGGGTFKAIASQIEPQNLDLIVTHAIFSQGYDDLLVHFSMIYCTDSFNVHNSDFIKCFSLEELYEL